MSQPDKSITLSPSWKAFIRGYLTGVLLTPLLIGFYILWRTYKKHQSWSFILTDRDITVVEDHISQKVDLANIQNTGIVDRRFGVGTIVLKTQARQVEMPGIENPERLLASIDKAIALELKRLEEKRKTQPRESSYDPGTMDRMEYLTGLWQQGLITDEEFHGQKKQFE